MPQETADILDELELFSSFPYPELKIVARYLTQLTAKPGEAIFNEGDPGSYMLILVEGRLSIFKGGENGSHLLSHEGKGRIVGEMALLDQERRSATCVAENDCTLLTLSHEGLEKMAKEHPALAYRFVLSLARMLSKRLRKTSGMLVEFLTH